MATGEPKVNPNAYDDTKHDTAGLMLTSAVRALWDAGLTLDDIRHELDNALTNVSANAETA